MVEVPCSNQGRRTILRFNFIFYLPKFCVTRTATLFSIQRYSYPHFYDKPIPGWFDKGLKGRVPHRSSYDNVVMLVPSASFVANLPYSKIPDRKDFEVLDAKTRIKYWQTVLKETDRLGEYFMRAVNDGSLVDAIKPLPFKMI